MREERRICCFCERWESGGIESFLCNVLNRVDMTDLQVDVVVSSLRESVFTKTLQYQGVRFYELSGDQRNIFKNHQAFRRIAREKHYDVLHLNAFHGLSLAYLRIAKEEGIPIRIAHSHNTALRKTAMRPFKQLLHFWAKDRYTRYATDLWACSEAAAEFLFENRQLAKQGFDYISNGIDTKRFQFDPAIRNSVRAAIGVEDHFVIGNIGRLCYQKNQMFLFDVLVEVQKDKPDAVLLLVGEGEEEAALRKRAKDLHIADKVIFYGTTAQPEKLLWAMDVFAFPSLFEGFGIAVLEALAAGLPVVCSENVPREVHISPWIQTVPLNHNASEWASALQVRKERNSELNDTVVGAGFEIAHTAQLIQERYQGLRPFQVPSEKN